MNNKLCGETNNWIRIARYVRVAPPEYPENHFKRQKLSGWLRMIRQNLVFRLSARMQAYKYNEGGAPSPADVFLEFGFIVNPPVPS